MGKYRVWHDGNGTGGVDNPDWSLAYATLALANIAAGANDIILIHYAHQETVGVDTTVTLAAGVTIVTVDKDDSENYRAMGTAGWVGTAAGAFQYFVQAGAGAALYIYGLTIRNGGSSADWIGLRAADGGAIYSQDCYLWLGTISTGGIIALGNAANDQQTYAQHINLTLRFGNAAQALSGSGRCEIIGGSVSAAGASASPLIEWTSNDPGGAEFTWIGGDLTHATGTLAGDTPNVAATIKFIQCRLHSSFTALATQTVQNRSHAEVYIIDCSDNAGTPKRGIWGYYNSLGSVIKETGIYVTAGATGWSWKVVGTSNATIHAPFHTPWIDFFQGVNTAITPRLEIFRDTTGETAYTDAQVWAEWLAKTTSGSDRAAFAGTDRQALNAIIAGTAGVAQAAGAGASSWATGVNGTDWSGKCDSGSAITAAEDGYLRGRIAVVGAITVYVNPEILTS